MPHVKHSIVIPVLLLLDVKETAGDDMEEWVDEAGWGDCRCRPDGPG